MRGRAKGIVDQSHNAQVSVIYASVIPNCEKLALVLLLQKFELGSRYQVFDLMENILKSAAVDVVKYLAEPALREAQLFFCADKVIEDLDNEKLELAEKRNSLLILVAQAKSRTEVINNLVEEWLNDVENLLKEVEDLKQKMEMDNSCFYGWCPTWRRYLLCKQMAEKIRVMKNFQSKSNIQPFSYRAPLPGIQFQASENFTYFEATKVAHNQLMRALQDDHIYMVGVYGMGGSGKSSLVLEVGKEVEGLNLFDQIISITISQTPNIRSLQGTMADMLNLKLEEESEEYRARRLWLSLKEKKRVLVILDDLWDEFKLRDIGICLDNDYRGRWKVLVTTRDQHVCYSMDCQLRIHLGLLSKDESWTLFQKHANIDDAFSKSLRDVPRKLCDECNGLPIAIAAVGSSLKGKSRDEWKMALHSLRHSEAIDDHIEGGVRRALKCLKLSYEYLKNEEAKLIFLMCSMYPEDHEISIEDLIRYAVGLGIGGKFSLNSARSWIRANVDKLLDSCLLMHVEKSIYNYSEANKDCVKMHDMVRDAALWIAKRSMDHKIYVNFSKPLSTLSEDYSISDCFAVSSWYKENQTSFQVDAPNLEFLLLNTWDSLNLSHATFEGIEGLKVFSVVNIYYHPPSLSLPQSTQLLTNLQVLRLIGWHLGDISFITSLIRLEVLDLQGCNFNELPNQGLKRLKLLDLSRCFIEENYNGAIGKCSQLEELYLLDCDPQYLYQSIADMASLPKLQRFVIYSSRIGCERVGKRDLVLVDFDISILGASKKNILQIAETICLESLRGGCKNIIPDMTRFVGGMNELSSLHLYNCTEIECIFDTTSDSNHDCSLQLDALIPSLVELRFSWLKNLKELCRGPPLQVLRFFEELEVLFIGDCHHLHSLFPSECNLQNLKILTIENAYRNCVSAEVLFSMSVAQSLQQLKELTIHGCDELKHIVVCGGEHGSNTSKEIVPATRDSPLVFPSLEMIHIADCRKLESLFPVCCVEGLAKLREMHIALAPELKYVFAECDHKDLSSLQYENRIKLSHFKLLTLNYLKNLIAIYPKNYHEYWPFLWKLSCNDCPQLDRSQIDAVYRSSRKNKIAASI